MKIYEENVGYIIESVGKWNFELVGYFVVIKGMEWVFKIFRKWVWEGSKERR